MHDQRRRLAHAGQNGGLQSAGVVITTEAWASSSLLKRGRILPLLGRISLPRTEMPGEEGERYAEAPPGLVAVMRKLTTYAKNRPF